MQMYGYGRNLLNNKRMTSNAIQSRHLKASMQCCGHILVYTEDITRGLKTQ